MTELFEPGQFSEKAWNSGDEAQSGRDLMVQGFFLVTYAAALVVLARGIAAGSGWGTGAVILAACSCACWSFCKFRKRS